MSGNLQEQGDDPNSFDFFTGFQDYTEFVHIVDFLDAGFDADFTYGDAFDFDSINSGSFEYDNVSCEFSVEHRRRRSRKKRRTNRVFQLENIKKSCWYRYFTRPGLTREITHELSNIDRYGEFRHWFRMPLTKVEELTNILIDREYINRPRSHWCRAVFRERLELLVMSVLYLLGTGAACRSCKPFCGISTSEVRKFSTSLLRHWWI